MRRHKLFAKLSKRCFGIPKVEYLGYLISNKGVETNPRNIEVISNWPKPQPQRDVRSFLGLIGYYKWFIKGYALISKALTDLLNKDGFIWKPEAALAFQKLKTAMMTASVLALPDFEQPFEIETDIGAVLQQKGHPIAYISKKLGPKWQQLPVYEKELLAIVFVVKKWEQYLLSKPFIIKADQKSLKHLLEQKISTPFQQFWLSKLMGFDYTIHYKSGVQNVVADSLSRVSVSSLLLMSISHILSDLLQLIENSWT